MLELDPRGGRLDEADAVLSAPRCEIDVRLLERVHAAEIPGLGSGSGGTYSGDSGCPIFVANTNVIAGVNSFGIAPYCKGNDYAFRTDTQVAHDFLGQFVSLR